MVILDIQAHIEIHIVYFHRTSPQAVCAHSEMMECDLQLVNYLNTSTGYFCRKIKDNLKTHLIKVFTSFGPEMLEFNPASTV